MKIEADLVKELKNITNLIGKCSAGETDTVMTIYSDGSGYFTQWGSDIEIGSFNSEQEAIEWLKLYESS